MYKSFMCYRMKSSRDYFEPSENIVGLVYYWLHNDSVFESLRPVLFEECAAPDENVVYTESGIAGFMPDVEHFICAMCPGFFEEILREYRSLALSPDSPLPESFLRKLESNGNISYLEIKHALMEREQKKRCFHPILIRMDGRSPVSREDRAILTHVFGEGIDLLIGAVNTPTIDYDLDCRNAMRGFSWSRATQAERREMAERLEQLPCISEFRRDFYNSMRPVLRTPFISAFEDTLKDDLQRCFTVISKKYNPYSETNGTKKDFHAKNPDVIYDPVKLHYAAHGQFSSFPEFPRLAKCLIDSFAVCRESMHLPSDSFSYWPVDMDGASTISVRDISVCAACFGTLIVHHRLSKDSIVLGTQADAAGTLRFCRLIDSGINMIIALRNPYTRTWPSSWAFNDELVGVDGTVNQTTLSLSTLMSCGFLSEEGVGTGGMTAGHLRARCEFVIESARELINMRIDRDTFEYSGLNFSKWGYTEHSRFAALVPTVFALDTLLKLLTCVDRLIPFFEEHDPEFCDLLLDLRDELAEVVDSVPEYLRSIQGDCGGFQRFRDGADENVENSITHTAYVVKLMCTYIDIRSGDDCEPSLECARAVLGQAEQYLMRRVRELEKAETLTFGDWEKYDDFCSSEMGREKGLLRSSAGDRYEHCIELIVAEALCKLAESGNAQTESGELMSHVHWILHNFSLTRIDRQEGINIRGNYPDRLKYPIYYVYYYRMVVLDYLRLRKQFEIK